MIGLDNSWPAHCANDDCGRHRVQKRHRSLFSDWAAYQPNAGRNVFQRFGGNAATFSTITVRRMTRARPMRMEGGVIERHERRGRCVGLIYARTAGVNASRPERDRWQLSHPRRSQSCRGAATVRNGRAVTWS